MNVKINDKAILLPENATLQEALDNQNIKLQGIATAVNGSVIPAVERVTTQLNDGDSIVIIKAFYGG